MPGSRARCSEDGGLRCLRAYAGLVGTLGGLGRAGGAADLGRPSHIPGVPAGTVVTPNYLDNVSARVAPWCGCEASGNRREECEAFRKLFTGNPCLGEGTGDPGEPRISMAQSKPPGPWGPLKYLHRVLFDVGVGRWAHTMVHG